MITEKQMMIVDAVNEMKADSAPLWATTVYINSYSVYVFWCNVTGQTVCTIEEYNQCIEEMKYHYDIPRWCSYNRADKEPLTVENSDYSFYEKEKFVYGQDVYINSSRYNNKKFKFGCFHVNKRDVVLFNEIDSAVNFRLSDITSKPFKSKEDIELEAKEDQVIDMIGLYYDAYYVGDIKNFFNLMQENGDLPPIELEKE